MVGFRGLFAQPVRPLVAREFFIWSPRTRTFLGLFKKHLVIALELFLPKVNPVIDMRNIKGVSLCSPTNDQRPRGAWLGLELDALGQRGFSLAVETASNLGVQAAAHHPSPSPPQAYRLWARSLGPVGRTRVCPLRGPRTSTREKGFWTPKDL